MISMLQERPPYVRFEMATVEYRDNNGQPHTRDEERILVTPAGSKDVHVANALEWLANKERMANDQPPQYNPQWVTHFRAAFDLWRKGHEVPENGTSIRAWPLASPSEVKRCIEANVLTIEDLAQANEPALQRLGMGGRALKDKATLWLAEREGPGKAVQQVEALKVENAELRRRLDEVEDALHSMTERAAERPRPAGKQRAAPVVADDRDVIR